MIAGNGQNRDAADIVVAVRAKGVHLWSHDGKLHYKAPKGTLSSAEIDRLRTLRTQIISFLEQSDDEPRYEVKLERRLGRGSAPLTFAQLSHWRAQRLRERPSIRQLAAALRLRGSLDCGLLSASLAEVIDRHEALRTQIVVVDDVPQQQVVPPAPCEISVHNCAALDSARRDAHLRRLLDEFLLEPVRVDAAPLFALRVVRMTEVEHVLIVGMEHMISDAVSLNILLRDLFAIYAQVTSKRIPRLPELSAQYTDYAVWRNALHSSWLRKHAGYWHERLHGCTRLRFPECLDVSAQSAPGRGTIPVVIDAQQKARLREWCRARRTTLVMSMFTVFAALVLRWCRSCDAVIRYQTDGRTTPEIQSTIGYFAAILHLRVELSADDTFIDLLERLTREYCNAQEHADHCYIDAQLPAPPFSANSAFNWVSQEPSGEPVNEDVTLQRSPLHFTHPALKVYGRDVEPSVLLYDTPEQIIGGVNFPLHRYPVESMQRFQRNLLHFLEQLVSCPTARVSEVAIAS